MIIALSTTCQDCGRQCRHSCLHLTHDRGHNHGLDSTITNAVSTAELTGPDVVSDGTFTPLPKEGGWRPCDYQFDEPGFRNWVDHLIRGHLRYENLQQLACPFCPTILVHDSPKNHDDTYLRESLQHLREHSPWMAGRCEWPSFHPGTFHHSDIDQPHLDDGEGSQPLQSWYGERPEYEANIPRQETLGRGAQVARRILFLRPRIPVQKHDVTPRTAKPTSVTRGSGSAASKTSGSGPARKRSWSEGPGWNPSVLTTADTTVLAPHDSECTFELEESSFEQWLDHIVNEHLENRPTGSMACPLCSEELLPADEDDSGHDGQIATRQRLQHLRVHSPWLAGRCEWTLFLQYPS